MAYVQLGNRGGKVLINEGFRYQLNKKTLGGKMHWRCWRQTCAVFLTTAAFNLDEANVQIQVLNTAPHNHPADTSLISSGAIRQQMVQAIQADPSRPIKRVYDEVVREADSDAEVPEFSSVRSRLQRQRSSLLPPIPETIDNVLVEGEWTRTWRGRDFLSHQDNDWGILVFGTSRNFARLERCQDVYIDGTFKTAPHPYTQFMTVHGKYMGRVVPLVMTLVTGKTVGQYRQILRHIKQEVLRITGQRWTPQRVITDFESSLLLAIETEMPNSRSSGCYFHFTQSLWRKVQEVGLAGNFISMYIFAQNMLITVVDHVRLKA